MSVLLTSSKKAVQAKLMAKKTKLLKAKRAIEQARRMTVEPPLSNSSTVVWYWTLDNVSTTLLFNKDKNEVWCNGYILETSETFDDGSEGGGKLSFGIYISEQDTMHDGQIFRILSACDNPQGYVYVLYVDGCLIPEHLSPGISAIVTTVNRQNAACAQLSLVSNSAFGDSPPSYDDAAHYDDLPVFFDSLKLKKDN